MTTVRTPLPAYTVGTIAGNAGSPTITGTGTNWMVAADTLGNMVNVVMGGDMLVVGSQVAPIRSVDSATQVTLEVPLTTTVNPGTAYRIIKYQPNQTGSVVAALLALQAMGSDATPEASLAVDSGAGRMKLRTGPAGDLQIAVGPTGTADAALALAIDISPAGAVSFPAGFGFVDTYRYFKAINADAATSAAGGVDAMLAFLDAGGGTLGSNAKRATTAFIATAGGDFETLVLSPWLAAAASATPPGVGIPAAGLAAKITALRQLALQQSAS